MIDASVSFRSVSASLKTIFSCYSYFENRSIPASKTVSRWLTQVGYYKLTRDKEKAEDWVYIIDNSIQVGKHKSLLILGFRISNLPKMRALTFEDMEPLVLEIHEGVNAEVVNGAIKRASEKTGPPRVICSDEGPDIKPGVSKFVEEHPTTLYIPDTIHKASNLLKSELKDNIRWKRFTELAKESKQKIQLTKFAYLVPPSQRSKCRFMNIDQLVHWGLKMIDFLKREECFSSKQRHLIEEHLGWLWDFEEDIKHFAVLSHILRCAREVVRNDGVHQDTQKDFENFLMGLPLSFEECQFAGKILDFFGEQSAKAKPWEILHGSSEIIESLFGKLKNLSNLDSTKGFSSLVLAAAACVGKTDEKVIAKAMADCRLSHVNEWVEKSIGKTLQSKRRLALKPLNILEQIFDKSNLIQEMGGVLLQETEKIAV